MTKYLVMVKSKTVKNPWITKGILKSSRTKQMLHKKPFKINPIWLGGGEVEITPTPPPPPQEKNVKNGKNRQASGLSGLFTKQNLVFDVS